MTDVFMVTVDKQGKTLPVEALEKILFKALGEDAVIDVQQIH